MIYAILNIFFFFFLMLTLFYICGLTQGAAAVILQDMLDAVNALEERLED